MLFPRSKWSKPHVGLSSLEILPQSHELPQNLCLRTVELVYWRAEGLQENIVRKGHKQNLTCSKSQHRGSNVKKAWVRPTCWSWRASWRDKRQVGTPGVEGTDAGSSHFWKRVLPWGHWWRQVPLLSPPSGQLVLALTCPLVCHHKPQQHSHAEHTAMWGLTPTCQWANTSLWTHRSCSQPPRYPSLPPVDWRKPWTSWAMNYNLSGPDPDH